MRLRRKDVILSSVVAFIAWGLAVQWLPILRFIGYAFVLGIILTVFLIACLTLTVSKPKKRNYSETFLLNSTPTFLIPGHWQVETSNYTIAQEYEQIPLYDGSFVLSQGLDSLISLVLRDFVSSWYKNITNNRAFINEIDKNIRAAFLALRDKLAAEDLPNVIVSRIIPIFTAHLKEFDLAERAVRGRALNRNVTESEELDLAIASKYRGGRLHPAVAITSSDTKVTQQEHLRKLTVRILPELLSEDIMRSRAVSVLMRELVACALLFPIMQAISDPDTWNQLIENYGRTTLQDRKAVRRMRAALDQHASPKSRIKSDQDFPRLSPNDSERAFERFVRAIRKTKNLSEARRFRSQVSSQWKRESMVEGQDPVYLRRLEMGKRVLDQKIAKLALAGGVLPAMITQTENRNGTGNANANSNSRELSLVEIMYTASGLSCFMEYMDRQQKMSLVQFWVVVDGFRTPLEDDFGEDNTPGQGVTWTEADRTDIAQISEAYMTKPELKIPSDSKDIIKVFLQAGKDATQEQYQNARTAILSAQSAVLEELESRHFPNFKKSDLYYQFLSTDEASVGSASTAAIPEPLRSPVLVTARPSLQSSSSSRSGSQILAKGKDLRRAALSSSDVRGLLNLKTVDDTDIPNRLTQNASPSPLFDDGYETDPLAHSTLSIGQESVNGDDTTQQQVIENMEAAMSSIMTQPFHEESLDDDGNDNLFGSPVSSHQTVRSPESPRTSLDSQRLDLATGERKKVSLATLGLVNTASRIGVFSDNDLFPDEEKFIEDEYADHDDGSSKVEPADDIHEAAPGDLGLAEAVALLNNDIEKLVSQEAVVDALTRKAELTNNITELRILGKSKSSLQREIRRKELQRQQYIIQESDNSLFGRSSIRIKSVVVGREEDGREFALYVIEVQRQAGDQMPAAIWAIARRYSEFHELHHQLRRRYPSTRNLDFPRRRVMMKLQKQFLHNRRIALETYLQQLLRMPDVCRSRELRSFLSQQAILSSNTSGSTNSQDIVTRIYNSVTDGMDEFLGNMAVLDQLSIAGQNLMTAASTQLGTIQPDVAPLPFESGSIAEAEAELRAFEDKELEPFVKPICDIFLELFELNRSSNWLRGRAVVVVLQQLLGGTVERKTRDMVKSYVQEESLLHYVDLVRDLMWPNGKMREMVMRGALEKSKVKKEATFMLSTLIPDLVGGVVGRANAQAAARRISATLNNQRLNQHLLFTILDDIVGYLFEGMNTTGFG